MTKSQSQNRRRFIIIGVIGLLIVIALGFPLWSPYFINDVVDEAFPGLSDDQRDSVRAMPEDQRDVLIELSDENPEMAAEHAAAMMEADHDMDEAMPADEPVALVTGTFSFLDAVHNGEGSATIYELPDGSHVLRLEDFRVTNGPDLHVILSTENPTTLFSGVGETVDLGSLKGNVGNQNYDIPEDVNIADFASVVIYCQPFHVVFSAAALDDAE